MKVKSIKEVVPRTVYAVKTSTGTYIADGLAHHNCAHCNVWRDKLSMLNGYAKGLDLKYGDGTAKKLEAAPVRYSSRKADLLEVIHTYSVQVERYLLT